MLAWKLKCSLSGDRWDFQVNMGSLRTRSLPHRTTRRRARCIVHDRKVAMLAWKLKCSLSGGRWDFQVNIGSLRTRLLPQRTTRRRALYAAAVNGTNLVKQRRIHMLSGVLAFSPPAPHPRLTHSPPPPSPSHAALHSTAQQTAEQHRTAQHNVGAYGSQERRRVWVVGADCPGA